MAEACEGLHCNNTGIAGLAPIDEIWVSLYTGACSIPPLRTPCLLSPAFWPCDFVNCSAQRRRTRRRPPTPTENADKGGIRHWALERTSVASRHVTSRRARRCAAVSACRATRLIWRLRASRCGRRMRATGCQPQLQRRGDGREESSKSRNASSIPSVSYRLQLGQSIRAEARRLLLIVAVLVADTP
jgi:hypothetical protein